MRKSIPLFVSLQRNEEGNNTNGMHNLQNTKYGYFGPAPYIPTEYVMRFANTKQLVFMDPKDPKFGWNTHAHQLANVAPLWGGNGGKNPNVNFFAKSGFITEIPPVPVYRQHIWCMGHMQALQGHPRINIKCMPGKVTVCKWCRLKFINMSTPEDNDDDWREVEHKIATTPESYEDLMTPVRDVGGCLRMNRFQEDGPDPHVYRAVLNPEPYRWHHEEHHDNEVHPRYAKKKCGDESCTTHHH